MVKKRFQDKRTKEYNICFLKILTWHPLIYTIDYPKCIVSNQKKESVSMQRAKTCAFDTALVILVLSHICEQQSSDKHAHPSIGQQSH